MKTEFTLAFNEVLDDKQLPLEVIQEAIEAAMVSAYRKAVNASTAQHVMAKLDLETGGVKIFAEKEIVEEVHDDRTEVILEVAKQYDPEAELGGMATVESTPTNFGRVAAQTARQVIQQRLREAERDAQFEFYSKQMGDIVSGVVQSINTAQISLGLEKKAEGIMPRKEQISGERFRIHDRVRALLLDIKPSSRGPQITLSRAHRNFLRRLLEDEVPEIYHGMVEIRSIAREPGQRSKVSVAALQAGIDPVGACVGVRGVRIQAIVRELNDEKIDVIEWSPEPAEYISKALSPARVLGVYLDKHSKTKTATVVVPEDQLSLAIGRDGQNARLAAKLTSWRIDIKSLPEAARDSLTKLNTDPEYADIVKADDPIIVQVEAILQKKVDGRPVTPEEYQVLNRFVQRVESSVLEMREEEKQAERTRKDEIRASIPDAAFKIQLDDLDISPRLVILLSGESYSTIGELMYQLVLDEDVILKLNGVGPKAMSDIHSAIERFAFPVAEPEPVVEEEAEAEPVSAEEEPVELIEVAQVEEAVETELAEPVSAIESEEVEAEIPSIDAVEIEADSLDVPKEGELEDVFVLPDLENIIVEEDEDEEEGKKKKKKGKKKFVELEYDPDKDVTLVHRKRKRATGEWGEEWSEEW